MPALLTYLGTLRETRGRTLAFQRAFGTTPEQFATELKARLDEMLR